MATELYKPKRRWLRFSLRSLLLAMLGLCVLLGWKVEKTKRQREAVAWVRKMEGEVQYSAAYALSNSRFRMPQHPPTWLEKRFGVDFFDTIALVEFVESDEWSGPNRLTNISKLAALTDLRELTLVGTKVVDLSPVSRMTDMKVLNLKATDGWGWDRNKETHSALADVSPLRKMTQLEYLYLRDTSVADLTPLRNMTHLRGLDLGGTLVTDLGPLEGMTELEWLDISATQVSDLSPLARMTNLRELFCGGTQVADLSPLTDLTEIRELGLSRTPVQEISALRGLSNLEFVYMSYTNVSDVSPIVGAKQTLQFLDISVTKVNDLSPLAKLETLHDLRIGRLSVDLTPLKDAKRLGICLSTDQNVKTPEDMKPTLEVVRDYD